MGTGVSKHNASNLRRRAKMLHELRAIPDPEGRIAMRIAFTRPLTAIEKEIVPELKVLPWRKVNIADGGRYGLCHHNCHEMAENDPSLQVVLGWLRTFEGGAIPRCYLSHSVLERNGELFDPTPRVGGLDPGPFVPDPNLRATWAQVANGDMRVRLTRDGVEIPVQGLRTADGIISLDWVWAYSLHPKTASRIPEYR